MTLFGSIRQRRAASNSAEARVEPCRLLAGARKYPLHGRFCAVFFFFFVFFWLATSNQDKPNAGTQEMRTPAELHRPRLEDLTGCDVLWNRKRGAGGAERDAGSCALVGGNLANAF